MGCIATNPHELTCEVKALSHVWAHDQIWLALVRQLLVTQSVLVLSPFWEYAQILICYQTSTV